MSSFYWHMLPDTQRTHYSNEPVSVGTTLSLPADAPLIYGYRGYHAAKRLIDCLYFAKGTVICKVTLADIQPDFPMEPSRAERVCARSRTCIAMLDAERGAKVLSAFCKWAAHYTIDAWQCADSWHAYADGGAYPPNADMPSSGDANQQRYFALLSLFHALNPGAFTLLDRTGILTGLASESHRILWSPLSQQNMAVVNNSVNYVNEKLTALAETVFTEKEFTL